MNITIISYYRRQLHASRMRGVKVEKYSDNDRVCGETTTSHEREVMGDMTREKSYVRDRKREVKDSKQWWERSD